MLVADAGTGGPPHGIEPDVTSAELAAEVGADLAALTDRGAAVGTMADAAAALARRLHAEGRIDGVLGAGGSGNTAIADRGDARAARRRAEAHGLDDGGRRHARLHGRRPTWR